MKWNLRELQKLKNEYTKLYFTTTSDDEYSLCKECMDKLDDLIAVYKNDNLEVKRYIDELVAEDQFTNNLIKNKNNLKDRKMTKYLIDSLSKIEINKPDILDKVRISDIELLTFLKIYNKKCGQKEVLDKCLNINKKMYYRKNNYENVNDVCLLSKGKAFITLNENRNLYDYICMNHETQHVIDFMEYPLPDSYSEIKPCLSNKYSIELIKKLGYFNESLQLNDINNYNYVGNIKLIKDLYYFVINYNENMSEHDLNSKVFELAHKYKITSSDVHYYVSKLNDMINDLVGFTMSNLIYDSNTIEEFNAVTNKYIYRPNTIHKNDIDESVKILKKQI